MTTVAFGGIRSGSGMPMPEFKNLLTSIGVNDAKYVVDHTQAWYQTERNGLYRLVEQVKDMNPTLLLGNSAGGFGALAVSAALGVKCLCFSPQSDLTMETRWPVERASMHPKSFKDLFYWFGEWGFPKGTIHYSIDHELDKEHAERVGGVTLVGWDIGAGHNLVAALKQRGVLADLIKEAL